MNDDKLEREISEQLKQLNILMRVNNVLISKFILQLQTVKKILNLPKVESFFRFELLQEEYQQIVDEFGKRETDNALYWLDRQMSKNKIQCPHNIKRYIVNKLRKKQRKNDKEETDKES